MRTIWKRLIVVKTSAQMTGGHSVVGCSRKYGMFVRAAATANQRNHRMSRTEYATSISTFEKCTR
jgi:hypothetical protein